MAQGKYYTRQDLNKLQQQRINARAAARAAEEEKKKIYFNPATGERQATKPENPYLAEMAAFRKEAEAAKAYKNQGGSGYYKGVKLGKYNVTNDDLKVVQNYKAYEKAIARGYSFEVAAAKQKQSYKNKERRLDEIKARNEGVTLDQKRALTKKFGSEVYGAMSPEARDYAYAQLQGRTTPTPNTAAAKDRYNRAQEEYVQVGKTVVASLNESYDRVQARRAAAQPKREDYKSSLAYNYAVREYNNTPRGVVSEATNVPRFKELNYQARSFQSTFMADPALQRSLGVSDTAGGANFGAALGAISYVPARMAAFYGAGRVISGVAGAGYSIGSGAGSSVGGLVGPTTATVLGTTGGIAGAALFSAPPVLLGTYAVTEAYSAPVNRALRDRGVDRGSFRTAYAQALEVTGGLGEISPSLANDQAFEANFRNAAELRGIRVDQGLINLANQQRTASTKGEAFGLVAAGAAANVLGARLSSVFGAGTVVPTPIGSFSTGQFLAIGIAGGATEGPISSYGQNIGRFESLSTRRAGIAAGFGFLTAGTLGGFVGGTTLAGQARKARFYEGVGFAADPSEFGSDLLTASNPYGNARVFATVVPPLSRSQGGPRELQPALTEFGIAPAPRPNPRPPATRPAEFNAFVSPRTNPFVAPNPMIDVAPAPEVPVSPRTNPFVPVDPFVPVNPAPNVPVAPPTNPFVPVNPNPVVDVPTNPLVDVPVSKFFIPALGRGSTIPSRGRKGFGSGFRKARYTASFAALELGIGSSNPRTKGSFTGFEIRPFLASERKKKKKGKRARAGRSRSRKPAFSLSLGASPL